MEVSGQLHAPAALLRRKSPWYPLDRKLGGPQSRSGHSGKAKEIPAPAWNPTLVIQLVAVIILAKLCRPPMPCIRNRKFVIPREDNIKVDLKK
jgi:hypothetical protein